MPNKLFLSAIFIGLHINFEIKAQLAEYYPNPGRGYMSNYKELVNKVANINEASPYYFSANTFKYIYLNEIFTNECISEESALNEKKIYDNIKQYFDAFLNEKSKTRYILRIFPNNEGNSIRLASLVNSFKSKNEKMYIWIPTKLYDIIEKSEYPLILGKAIYPQYFQTTNNVGIIDYRNELVQKVYDTVLRLFSLYLEEKITAPQLTCDTNMPTRCKRGDLIHCIEMGFVGSWGEGITTDYSEYSSSTPLIHIAELYKKHLSNYLLIAPSYGMRTNTTTNPALYHFQYYLLTTTYGTLRKDKKGLYYGNKEFGLFMDHLGSTDYLHDFNLKYQGQILKDIAKEKHKTAPFIGENSGKINSEKELIMQNINEYGISCANLWSAIPVDSITDNASYIWKTVANQLGYSNSLKKQKHKTKIRNGILTASFSITNTGTAIPYHQYWLPQLVIRDKEDKILQIINIDKELNLNTILPSYGASPSCSISINIRKKVVKQFDGMKIYLRFVDKKHINENMFIVNEERSDKGEYPLTT